MFIDKLKLIIPILLFSLFVFLCFVGKVNAIQYCTLDVYLKDQNNNPIAAEIYVDDSYRDYDDHITFTIQIGTHKVEARKSGYESDVETLTCSCSETRRIDLTLRRTVDDDVDIRIGDLNTDPDYACIDDYETVTLSIPLTLEYGNDDTLVTAKFYVQDDDDTWHYIGKDEQTLYRDETRTFNREFDTRDYFSNEGIFNVKVKIESGDFERTVFSDLHINDCYYREYMIDVGSISVDNEYPDKGDILQVSVPITLDYTRYSRTVYVYGYVDDNLVNSINLIFDGSGTETYQFTIDTERYSNGPHTIKVKAEFRGRIDTSTKTFSISPFGYYPSGMEHCISIDKAWTDDDLKAGESNRVNVKVLSCGTKYEKNVKMKLEAFSKTYYTGEFDLSYGGTRDVFVTVTVPEDASDKQNFKVTVWNSYTSNTWSKEFVVYTGVPFIDIKPDFTIDDCQKKRISFDVVNKGKVSDTFTISLTGSAAGWMDDVPEEITLDSDERKTIDAYVSVPCGIEPGFYELKINAKGSPEYSVTSTIRVIRPLRWPVIFPTGFFINVGGIFWLLAWVIIILLVVFLILFFTGYITLINNRKRPMFDCCNNHGC